jgi:uncharacterized protein YcnI
VTCAFRFQLVNPLIAANRFPMKLPRRFLFLAIATVLATGAMAHVRVKPNQSQPGAMENYLLRVPSEGGRTTTGVVLTVPDGVNVTAVGVPLGGPDVTVHQRKDGDRVVEIAWDVEIKPDAALELPFVAQNPATGDAIVWKAVQKYSDGSTSAWTGAKGTKSPAAVTNLGAPAEK